MAGSPAGEEDDPAEDDPAAGPVAGLLAGPGDVRNSSGETKTWMAAVSNGTCLNAVHWSASSSGSIPRGTSISGASDSTSRAGPSSGFLATASLSIRLLM